MVCDGIYKENNKKCQVSHRGDASSSGINFFEHIFTYGTSTKSHWLYIS